MSANRLHPLSAVTTALQRGVVGLSIPFFLVSMLSAVVGFVEVTWAFVLSPVGFAVGVGYGIAYYYRFEYELTDDTFDLASGVVSRRSREIPFGRIQNVDVKQGVVSRLLGIAVVTVETAGGGDTEATLDFVAESEATRLQRDIRRLTAESSETRRAATTESEGDGSAPAEGRESMAADASEVGGKDGSAVATHDGESAGAESDRRDYRPTQLFEMDARELLLYSFASFRLRAAAGILFVVAFAFEPVLDVLVSVAEPLGGPESLETGTARNYAVLAGISILHGAVATYLLGVVYAFVRYYGFRLGRAGDDVVYERGLIQRYSGSVPIGKIQSVTITDNPLQRLIGYAGLWVETAGYGPDSTGGSQSAVPLARAGRVYGFVERFTGLERPAFERPPTLARRRYLGRYSIVATAVVAVVFLVSLVTSLERWYLAAVVFLAVPPAAALRYANLGYHVGEDHLVIRSGFWRRRTTVIPYYRIQTVSTRRSVFQRRLGLASLVIDTASSQTFAWRTPTIYDVSLETARSNHATARERLQSSLDSPDRAGGTFSAVLS